MDGTRMHSHHPSLDGMQVYGGEGIAPNQVVVMGDGRGEGIRRDVSPEEYEQMYLAERAQAGVYAEGGFGIGYAGQEYVGYA
ncbi:hypothetical protein NMY22_g5044 [Coprinellus aureogranulatus]|nr:hypothetical protein NMY22_g5044 [Coprinellus aureogranulatus]